MTITLNELSITLLGAKCCYSECRYAECRIFYCYAECHYAECHGTCYTCNQFR